MAVLYVVSTPIGNLDDISIRAKKILGTVSMVLAEDTRQSRILLSHIGASPKLVAFHDFNKEKAAPAIIAVLKQGTDMAIICDAGTPGIADEAFYLVREAIRNGIAVVPVPGASALLAALVGSGLPTDRFVFENFLPAKSGRRRKFLEELKSEHRTVVFYESPFRIVKMLGEMNEVLGDVSVAIGRELTKIHEEFLRGTPKSLLEHFSKNKPRGEMVVVVNTRVPANETNRTAHGSTS
ncbi:MAG TPA: 16S rRNA (cytidine(1402)-2'-O)-methyltransferase [Chitinivibrionales bacterium]|nr:16S rRNA (cytidine(1402)-2'-O)-methyltransferase [Chitinivibrionales bacterium]